MAVYIQINSWTGSDTQKAVKQLAKVFKLPGTKAKSVLQWIEQGKQWKYSKSVPDPTGTKAQVYLQQIGFDVELLPATDALASEGGAGTVAPADDSSLLELKKGYVFFAILLTIITLGIYVPYWFKKHQKALNQLDSDKKLSGQAINIYFILVIGSTSFNFLIGFLPAFGIDWSFLSPFINLVSLVNVIFLLIFVFRVRRILLDHMAAHYRVVSKISGVLTFFFSIYYLQYKINSVHKWHEERRTGDLVLRGDGLVWGMACLFFLAPIGVGILAAIAIPQFNAYKVRAYNSDAKSNLHNIFLACKAYWADNGSDRTCSPEIASGPMYGYIKSPDVIVTGSGTEKTFSVTAYNTNSDTRFSINSYGNIRQGGGASQPASQPAAKANPEGYTAIHYAAMDGNLSQIRTLLSSGQDPGTLSKGKETPLHWAAIKGYADVAAALLQAGADPNVLSNFGPSPLHLAIQNKHRKVVDVLLDNGANINIKATNGWTPLYMAQSGGQKEMIAYLQDRGAR